jgi:RHS repeat-associated protein
VEQWFDYDRYGNRTYSNFTFSSPGVGARVPDELVAWTGQSNLRNDPPSHVTSLATKADLYPFNAVDDLGQVNALAPFFGDGAWRFDSLGRVVSETRAGNTVQYCMDSQGLRFKELDVSTNSIKYNIYGFDQDLLSVFGSGKAWVPNKAVCIGTRGGAKASLSGEVYFNILGFDLYFNYKAPKGARFRVLVERTDGPSYENYFEASGAWDAGSLQIPYEDSDESGAYKITFESPSADNSDLVIDNVDVEGDRELFYDFERGLEQWVLSGPMAILTAQSDSPISPSQPALDLVALDQLVYLGGQLIAEHKIDATYYVMSDQVGSPNIITDESANRFGLEKNLPFGERFINSGMSSCIRYAGHMDQPGSPVYMKARMYFPILGHFASTDPGLDQKIQNKDSWNLFSYCGNNPVTNSDPTGMEVEGTSRLYKAGGHSEGDDDSAERYQDRLKMWAQKVAQGLKTAAVKAGTALKTGLTAVSNFKERNENQSLGLGRVTNAERGPAVAKLRQDAGGSDFTKAYQASVTLSMIDHPVAFGIGGGVFAIDQSALQSSFQILNRVAVGADGGQSVQVIESAEGQIISRTHVVVDQAGSEVLHMHQNHIGTNGGVRQFPDSWTGTTTVNAPYENTPSSFGPRQ